MCVASEAPPASAGHFGAGFSLGEPARLSAALERATQTPEGTGGGVQVVQVEGEVASVCQKRGCWMVLADGSANARILIKDHAFSIPVDSRGKTARVEGTLETRTFSAGQVRHLEHDAGRTGDGVVSPRQEWVLIATAVELR